MVFAIYIKYDKIILLNEVLMENNNEVLINISYLLVLLMKHMIKIKRY